MHNKMHPLIRGRVLSRSSDQCPQCSDSFLLFSAPPRLRGEKFGSFLIRAHPRKSAVVMLLYSRNSYPAALIPSTTFSRVRVTSSAVSVRSSAPRVSRKETLFLSGGSGKISRNWSETRLSPAD